MKKLARPLGLLLLVASLAHGQGVMINEVNTAANAWVEIVNTSSAPVDISGWMLQGFWDNPSPSTATLTFTFPGVGGSGTTFINPEQCILVSDNGTDPVTPVGTVRFTGINVPWFTGVPVSLVLTDSLGNGVDYIAFGNTNTLQAPLALMGGTPTVWTGPGAPNIGGTASGTTANTTYRHGRVDTNNADDWTNFGAAGTPGVLNPFQTLAVNSTGILPVATFAASQTCGPTPLTVRFTNTSTGQVELSLTNWDFDVAANPGVNTSTLHHAANTFTTNASVNLTILDVLGNMSTSANTAIMAVGTAVPAAPAPCLRQNFENFPPLIVNPCGGPMVPDPATFMEYRAADAVSRFRLLDRTVLTASGAIAWAFPSATATSGNNVVILDAVGGAGTNEIIVHFDGTAIGNGAGFTIRYSLLENNDETDPADVVALQDGVTLGNGVINTGGSTGAPGSDGFREVLLNNWNTAPINRAWMQFSHTIDAAFLATNGLVLGPNMRLIIRQRDNTTFELNDGLAIDGIEIADSVVTIGNGQPGVNGFATMDLNSALNLNCNVPGNLIDPNGPFFANATVGGPMNFTFNGPPNQPIILLAGNLNPGVFTIPVPGAGQVDVGIASAIPPFIPTGITIVADGTQPTFINSLFNTGPNGTVGFTFATPAFPPGVFTTFQAAIFNATTVVGMSNAVQLTIL